MCIDDEKEALGLMRKMEAALPIPARPRKALVRWWRTEAEVKISTLRTLQIESVYYLGDDGGIMCALDVGSPKKLLVASLTHLNVQNSHPLAPEIRAYQRKRKKRLAEQDPREGPWPP